jgi:hypothetical protein
LHKLERDNLEIYDMVKELKQHMGKQGTIVQLQQDPGFDNPSQPIRSVGSAGAHRHDGPMNLYPVDDIIEKTNCELHQPMKNISLRVATGFALACEPGARRHGGEIEAGYIGIERDPSMSPPPQHEDIGIERDPSTSPS